MKEIPHKPTPADFGINQNDWEEYEKLLRKNSSDHYADNFIIVFEIIVFVVCLIVVVYFGSPYVNIGSFGWFCILRFVIVTFGVLVITGCLSFVVGFILFPVYLLVDKCLSAHFDNRFKTALSSFGNKEAFDKYNRALEYYHQSEFSSPEHYSHLYPGIDEFEYNREKYIESKLSFLVVEIKKEISYLNSQINEKWWFDLSPKEFENEVALWFGRQGYIAKTTTYVGDGGVDVVLEKQGEKIYVQCKHYNSPVGVAVLRELFGVVKSDNVSAGILVCLVNPTKGAQDFAQNNGIRVITAKELAAKSTGIGNIDKGVIYVDANKIIGKEEPCVYVGPLGLVFNLFHYEKDAKSFAQKLARNGYYSTIVYVDSLYYVIVSKDSVLTKTRLFQRFGCYPSHAVVSD